MEKPEEAQRYQSANSSEPDLPNQGSISGETNLPPSGVKKEPAKKPRSSRWALPTGLAIETRYVPASRLHPEQWLPDLAKTRILDQGGEGASVGFGIASVVNRLLAEQGIYDPVSPRMLYQLAKQASGSDWDVDNGAYLPKALVGFAENGVCPEWMWPYRAGYPGTPSDFTEERRHAGMKIRPAGFRYIPPGKAAVQRICSAVFEHHSVLIGLAVHDGWQTDSIRVVPHGETFLGSHALAAVGYTPEGLILQNSWGSSWGALEIEGKSYPGMVILPYDDFAKNFSGGWVIDLAPVPPSAFKLRRAGYQSDLPGGEDLLDITPEVQAISAVLAAKDVQPPLALGLFGNWGSGKSFFMEKIQQEIEELAAMAGKQPENQSAYCQKIVSIRFNAWSFMDANLWASLAAEIFQKLFEYMSGPEEVHPLIAQKLSEANGLYQESRQKLDSANQKLTLAKNELNQKVESVKASKEAEVTANIQAAAQVPAMAKIILPEQTRQMEEMAGKVGLPALVASYQKIQSVSEEVTPFWKRVSVLLKSIFNPQGLAIRVVWLAIVVGIGIAVFNLFNWVVGSFSGGISEIGKVAANSAGIISGAVAWVSMFVRRGNRVLDLFEKEKQKARQDYIAQKTKSEQQAVVDSEKVLREAEDRVRDLEQQVQRLEEEYKSMGFSRQIRRYIEERGSTVDYRSQLGIISLIRRDFEHLSKLFSHAGQPSAEDQEAVEAFPFDRIILYIDDLDRCKPERVVEVLEAVHLLLSFPLFVAVVAVDPRWLRQCLEKYYPELLSTDASFEPSDEGLLHPSTPQDYLEKIFQIPYYLRPINRFGYENLITGLVSVDVEPDGEKARSAPGTLKAGQTAQEKKGTPVKASDQEPPLHDTPGIVGGITQPGVASPAQPETVTKPLNPELLKFKAREKEDLKIFAPLFHTPRSVKRFINTYRLVRVGLKEDELERFVGTDESPGYSRVAQALLAVVCGLPNIAPRFLRLMMDTAANQPQVTWLEFLEACTQIGGIRGTEPAADVKPGRKKKLPENDPEKPKSPPEHSYEWIRFIAALKAISADDFLPSDLSSYALMFSRVARFSFSVNIEESI